MPGISQKNNIAAKQPFMFHYRCFLPFSAPVWLVWLSQNVAPYHKRLVTVAKCRDLSQTVARSRGRKEPY
jgi:hypothetical protein